MGTASYVCSPGAASTCSFWRSCSGSGGAGAASNPSCGWRGVGWWIRIGGACSFETQTATGGSGETWVETAYWVGDWPASAAWLGSTVLMAGNWGVRGVCEEKPGVLG